MSRATYQRLKLIAKYLITLGLGATILGNLAILVTEFKMWWLSLLFPIPGLLGWLGLWCIPLWLGRTTATQCHAYRLLYSTTADWQDDRARQALLTLLKSGIGLDIIWAKDGADIACWLSVTDYGDVLKQLVQDIFPNGTMEETEPPEIGQGVVILHWIPELGDLPTPAEICQKEGVTGICFRWCSETTATIALWGPAALEVAQQLAKSDDIVSGQGQMLLTPQFSGDNPWPMLPPFPPSTAYPGLSAISLLERVAPSLRVKPEATALVIGQDAETQPIGFTWPELMEISLLQVTGQATESVVINLVQQAVQANQPVLLLDGQGMITTRLARRLLREVATEQILICDAERPGQSRFHLNPLWLPPEMTTRDQALSTGWLTWLRDLGVTAAGLGLTAFRHTQVAVILTALMAAERDLRLDIPGLQDALQAPDFLKLVDDKHWANPELLNAELWEWWGSEGQATTSFDMHLRLTHLRDRLGALLDLPEYSVLWRGPYLDPKTAVTTGQSLFWRLPDPRQRLSAYVASQLLALHTLLITWAQDQPLLIFWHDLPTGPWLKPFTSFPHVRLVVSSSQPNPESLLVSPTSLLVSRLVDDVPPWLQHTLPDIRPTDLKRLPPNRLVFKRDSEICTVDLNRK